LKKTRIKGERSSVTTPPGNCRKESLRLGRRRLKASEWGSSARGTNSSPGARFDSRTGKESRRQRGAGVAKADAGPTPAAPGSQCSAFRSGQAVVCVTRMAQAHVSPPVLPRFEAGPGKDYPHNRPVWLGGNRRSIHLSYGSTLEVRRLKPDVCRPIVASQNLPHASRGGNPFHARSQWASVTAGRGRVRTSHDNARQSTWQRRIGHKGAQGSQREQTT
jgi:hypothetical protein